MRAALAARHPDLVATWDAANQARGRNDLAAARAGYEHVVAAAPDFDHAHRRLCVIRLQQQDRAGAVAECEAALALSTRPENQTALAFALVDPAAGPVDAAARARALELAVAAQPAAAHDPELLLAICVIHAAAEDPRGMISAAEDLVSLTPDGLQANMFAAYAAQMEGRWEVARARLEQAHAAGLDDQTYREMRAELDRDHPPPGRCPCSCAWRSGSAWGGSVGWSRSSCAAGS